MTRELKEWMEREARLLERYADLEEKLPASYRNREWAEVEAFVGELVQAARHIEEAEARREASFQALKAAFHLGEDEGFRSLARKLPAEERESLAAGFRSLKAAVVRVKCASSRMNHYFQAVSESIDAILSELLPQRRGRIYSRQGKAREAVGSSLIIDREL